MQNNTENQAYAGFFVRLVAFLVDQIIIGIGTFFVSIPFAFIGLILPNNFLVRDFIFQYSITDILFYAVGVAYFVLFTYQGGATVGKMLLQIQVVSVEDRKMTLLEIIYRETIGRFLSGLLLCLGYFLVIFHKEKRGIHDLLSDTKVVYCVKKKVVVEVPIRVQEVKRPAAVKEYTPASYMPIEESKEETVEEPTKIVAEVETVEEKIEETVPEEIPTDDAKQE